MYYEEKIIDGRLCWRSTPDGEWRLVGEAKFTKGPWKWATSNSWRRLISHADESRPVPVLVPIIRVGGHSDTQINEYDMALIAAAPDLYEALDDCIDELERVERLGMKVSLPVLVAAQSALAKAAP